MDLTEVRILTTFHRFVPAGEGKEAREDYIAGATYQVDADTADLWCDVKGLAIRTQPPVAIEQAAEEPVIEQPADEPTAAAQPEEEE